MTIRRIDPDAPAWAQAPDHTADLSDAWQEQVDPQGEWGESCLGYFTVETVEAWSGDPYDERNAKEARLDGISVDDGHGMAYYDRDRAMMYLGRDYVREIDEWQSDLLTEAME